MPTVTTIYRKDIVMILTNTPHGFKHVAQWPVINVLITLLSLVINFNAVIATLTALIGNQADIVIQVLHITAG
uniref:Uncharacterized protein n=1 Tax=Acrobeloides nanus TaxID=290746 RepID=A0A914DLD6_9BILA